MVKDGDHGGQRCPGGTLKVCSEEVGGKPVCVLLAASPVTADPLQVR